MSRDKIRGIILGCAVGDALGAPVEFLGREVPRTLDEVLKVAGPNGVDRMMEYNHPDVADHNGVGSITDDTTMLGCAAWAIGRTLEQPFFNFEKSLIRNTREVFRHWNAAQKDGENALLYTNPDIQYPDEVKNLWFRCAAGYGTVSILSTEQEGTLENLPKSSYNGGMLVQGCGGMMRAAILAACPDSEVRDFFALGKKHAAITHGGTVANLATGVIVNLAAMLYRGESLKNAISETQERLAKEEHSEETLKFFNRGVRLAKDYPFNSAKMNSLIENSETRVYDAGPVLAQVMYVLNSVARTSGFSMEEIFTLAVTHRGDTDSVGAIVGGVLGAYVGYDGLPTEWVYRVQKNYDLTTIAEELANSLDRFHEQSQLRVAGR